MVKLPTSFAVLAALAVSCQSRPGRSFDESLRGEPVRVPRSAGPRGPAPASVTLPIGAGLAASPSAVLVGATVDVPLDEALTLGPSLQYGGDSDTQLVTAMVQAKYFLGALGGRDGSLSLLPYATAGFGLAHIDRDRRGSDQGAVFQIGAGLRISTGEHYRLGSEVRFHFLPDEVGGDRGFTTFEVLQVVFFF